MFNIQHIGFLGWKTVFISLFKSHWAFASTFRTIVLSILPLHITENNGFKCNYISKGKKNYLHSSKLKELGFETQSVFK